MIIHSLIQKDSCFINCKDKEKIKFMIKYGDKVIKQKKFCILILSGGQGTRLEHNGPKGTFKIELKNKISLFELFFF